MEGTSCVCIMTGLSPGSELKGTYIIVYPRSHLTDKETEVQKTEATMPELRGIPKAGLI